MDDSGDFQGFHQPNRAVLSLLPPKVQLQLARDSAAAQDMTWLSVLHESGFMRVPVPSALNPHGGSQELPEQLARPQPLERRAQAKEVSINVHEETCNRQLYRLNPTYHPKSFPGVTSICDVVRLANGHLVETDPYSGEKLGSSHAVFQLGVASNKHFLSLFETVVRDFIRDSAQISHLFEERLTAWANSGSDDPASKLLSLDESSFKASCQATAGVLLTTACLLKLPECVKALGVAYPAALDEPVAPSASAMGLDGKVLITPVCAAVTAGSRECVDALIDAGLKLFEPAAWDLLWGLGGAKRTHGARSIASTGPFEFRASDTPVLGAQWLDEQLKSGGLFTYPSVIERYMGALVSVLEDEDNFVVSRDALRTGLIEVASRIASENNLSPLVAAALRHGLFDLDPTQVVMSLCRRGGQEAFDALEMLASKIDWSRWDPAAHGRPGSDGALGGALSMEEFPVCVLAREVGNSIDGPDDEEQFETVLTSLIQCCVEAGYGHLITNLEQQASPARAVAEHQLAKPLLACLEAGADPQARPQLLDVAGRDPNYAPSLLELVEDTPVHDMVLAFLARQSAAAALAELDIPAGRAPDPGA